MGYENILPPITSPIEEKRRNWLLRIRFGPPWLYSRLKLDPLDDLYVKGTTVSQCTRLPSLGNRHSHSRPMPNVFSGQATLGIQGVGRSLDALSLSPVRVPLLATGSGGDGDLSDDGFFSESMQMSNSCGRETKAPRTAPGGLRRWSDVGQPENEFSIQPGVRSFAFRRSSDLAGYGQALDDDTIPTYVETLDNPESATRYRDLREKLKPQEDSSERMTKTINTSYQTEKCVGRVPPLSKNTGKPPNLSREKSQKHIIGKEKAKRPNNMVNTSLYRNRSRKVLAPSGGSTSALNRTSSLTSSKNTSGTRIAHRKYSVTGRFNGLGRKSEAALKTRKIIKPESPPGVSQEEMEEIQELPIIRKFLRMPASRPKVVCFDFPGVGLTHLDVKDGIEKVIPDAFTDGKVVSVQFENVNVKLATGGLDNRWLIELRDFTTRNKLIKNGLSLECARKSDSFADLGSSSSEEPGTSGTAEKEQPASTPIDYPRSVPVKLYDAVSMEEYKLYLRRTAAEEKLQNVILLCAGRGDKLLSNML